MTPLHYAAEKGHNDIAQLLLQAGADKEAKADVHILDVHILYTAMSILTSCYISII